MESENKVIVDVEKLEKFVDDFAVEYELEAPELKEILGLNGNEIPIMKVRPASLDDHIKSQDIVTQTLYKLKILHKELDEKGLNEIDTSEYEALDDVLDDRTIFEVNLFSSCVIEPKFTPEQVIEMSKVMPDFINKVAAFVTELTNVENGYGRTSNFGSWGAT